MPPLRAAPPTGTLKWMAPASVLEGCRLQGLKGLGFRTLGFWGLELGTEGFGVEFTVLFVKLFLAKRLESRG